MNISEPFIRRPIATTLLTIDIALAGAVAFRLLPVSPLPQVDFPTINVAASLPGASPEIMASASTSTLTGFRIGGEAPRIWYATQQWNPSLGVYTVSPSGDSHFIGHPGGQQTMGRTLTGVRRPFTSQCDVSGAPVSPTSAHSDNEFFPPRIAINGHELGMNQGAPPGVNGSCTSCSLTLRLCFWVSSL